MKIFTVILKKTFMDLNCKIIILVVNNAKEYEENLFRDVFLFHNSHQQCACERANLKVISANKQQVPIAQ